MYDGGCFWKSRRDPRSRECVGTLHLAIRSWKPYRVVPENVLHTRRPHFVLFLGVDEESVGGPLRLEAETPLIQRRAGDLFFRNEVWTPEHQDAPVLARVQRTRRRAVFPHRRRLRRLRGGTREPASKTCLIHIPRKKKKNQWRTFLNR